MRLCTPVSLCLAAAAALLPTANPAHAEARQPACAAGDDRAFPLTTRLRGGPGSYTAGGGYGTWYLDLTNTTTRPCTGIHPVVVLVDAKRALKPTQPRLEFYVGTRPHPVRFESTDQDELVGAFSDDKHRFPGFTVGPGRTLTVKVRLALTSDAVPNDVTARAAVVQRRDDDGDWVGESNAYRFGIDTGTDADTGTDTDTGTDADTGTGTGTEPRPDASDGLLPSPSVSAVPSAGRFPFAKELAGTGTGVRVLAAGAVLLLAGGGALLLARRRR